MGEISKKNRLSRQTIRCKKNNKNLNKQPTLTDVKSWKQNRKITRCVVLEFLIL